LKRDSGAAAYVKVGFDLVPLHRFPKVYASSRKLRPHHIAGSSAGALSISVNVNSRCD